MKAKYARTSTEVRIGAGAGAVTLDVDAAGNGWFVDASPMDDAEFLPDAPTQWNTGRYRRKLAHEAHVLGEMGTDIFPDGLVCFGVSEVENLSVVQDLVNTPPLDKRHYRIIHHDSPDRRGIDVAFIYNPKYFTVLHEKIYPLRDPNDSLFRTRDQLVVTGLLGGLMGVLIGPKTFAVTTLAAPSSSQLRQHRWRRLIARDMQT